MNTATIILSAVLIYLCKNTDAGKRTPEEWKSRIIYQILTDRFSISADEADAAECTDLRGWCGGTWRGIIDQLDYIQGLGANAIWISPIVENTSGGYHGYWAKNIYELNAHFGTEDDLRALVEECHSRDLWVMVDVVPNHMGYPHGCSWPGDPDKEECDDEQLQNYTGFTPFGNEQHYHSLCHIMDYDNQTQVELCRLANLPDLNQTEPEVREILLQWIHNLTLLYDFDGYRVDTVRHIAIEFWGDYQEAADNFLLGECWNEDEEYVGKYQDYMDSLFNFPSVITTNGIFHDGDPMTKLGDTLEKQRTAFHDVSVLGILADNHDMPRFLNQSNDITLLKNVLVYVFVGEGIPIIYYGTEQAYTGGFDPYCRESLWPNYDTNSEMYQYIASLATFRNENIEEMKTPQSDLYADDTTFVFSRDNDMIIAVMSKLGSGYDRDVTVGGLAEWEGNEYTNIWNDDDVISVSECSLNIQLINGQPKVYIKTGNGTAVNPEVCPTDGSSIVRMCPALFLLIWILIIFN